MERSRNATKMTRHERLARRTVTTETAHGNLRQWGLCKTSEGQRSKGRLLWKRCSARHSQTLNYLIKKQQKTKSGKILELLNGRFPTLPSRALNRNTFEKTFFKK